MPKKKKKSGQLALDLKMKNDQRRPKIGGLIALLLSAYLGIAFVSYLFTWYRDQNHVLFYSWSLLFESEVEIDNWLGKLGAITSNFFIYWGFGIGSFILVYLLFRFGLFLVLEQKLKPFWVSFRKGILLMVVVSVYCAFIFQQAGFPYGGAFGSKVSGWLIGLIGQIGMTLLLVATIIGTLVWFFNPDFNNLGIPAWMTAPFRALRNFNLFSRSMDSDLADEPDELVIKNRKKEKAAAMIATAGDSLDLELDSLSREARPVSRPDLELETIDIPEKKPVLSPVSDLQTTPVSLQEGTHPVVTDDEAVDTEPYDPKKELSRYKHPEVELLHDYSESQVEIDRAELEVHKNQIIETLLNYKIEITKIRATIGPTVTLFEIVPAPGIKISKIRSLEDDIALSMSALGIRIIAPIPGKGTIGIEVPNKKKQIVGLREVIASDKFKNVKMDLPIAIGKTISNEVFVADLAKMPHLLIAGATGQGKSVGINSVLISLLYRKHPSQLKLVLIDPKKVELYPYGFLENHFLAFLPEQTEPIVTDNNQVIYTLNSLCIEMDARYELLKRAKTRNLREYNDKFTERRLNPNDGHRFMPFIVLVIDEFADLILTAGREVEQPLARLAQLARAVGIHLIIATQRPSVNIITGSIKANFPARIAFKVASKVDSRTILDGGGADQLIGQGDMLLSVGGDMIRLQGAFVDTSEVERVIDFIGKQQGFPEPYFLPEFNPDNPNGGGPLDPKDLDELFGDAARLVVSNQHGSTSMIQRRLKLGYNRAGRIMDQLEAMGIVGASEGSKPREVLIYDPAELERYLEERITG
ncbi:MAG: DNA translocase FtsK [Saprospiraceae bacterium]|nr:DNA translocase FtsK [Saprospiraceae bacterium]